MTRYDCVLKCKLHIIWNILNRKKERYLLKLFNLKEDGEHPETTSDDETSERQQQDRDRQMRAIVEREREVHQQLAGHLRNLHKEREHHKRDEAMRAFNALLADLVRNPDLTWKEVKKQLRKDSRWESVEQLDRDDRERIFNDHIIQLGKKKRDKFREMLNELPQFDLIASWKDIKKQVRDDPRYLKYNSSDKCEREYREYIRDKTTEAKVAFKELLQECKLITYKSFELVKENALHLKEIEDILKNDKRYDTNTNKYIFFFVHTIEEFNLIFIFQFCLDSLHLTTFNMIVRRY